MFRTIDPLRTRAGRSLPALLLALHAGLLLHSLRLHSVTIDESAHIPSGLVHWHAGTFAAYRVNPPLPRMLATLPLLAVECQWVDDVPGPHPDPFARPEWHFYKTFFQFNRDRYQDLVCLARLAGVAWSCLGGWLVFRWAGDLYGRRGGLLALAVWVVEPTILGHAQVVTPDLPCAVAGLLAMYVFQHYLRAPAWPGAVLVGMTLGLALLTKFTLLALFPVCLILLFVMPRSPGQSWGRTGLVRAGHAFLAIFVTLLVINLGYLFEGNGRRLGEMSFVSRSFAGPEAPLESTRGLEGAGNRFRASWLGRLPVPVPEDWLRGIDVQRRDFEEMRHTRPSYLAGEWRDGGWWYYYLYALAVKLPVGVVAFAFAGLVLAVVRHRAAAPWRDERTVWLPAIAIIVLVSSQTGFNHHMRYVLPALPFLIVGTGKLGWFLQPGRWPIGAVVLTALLWAWGSSLAVYPHSLSYFNEPAGGPANGHAHLLDSNIDWGQDVLFLKQWLEKHPEARPMHLAVSNFTAWDVTGLPELRPPPGPGFAPPEKCGPRPGYYAISVNVLRGLGTRSAPAHSLEYFQYFQPIDRVGYTILVYRIEPLECDRVRQQLGLLSVGGL